MKTFSCESDFLPITFTIYFSCELTYVQANIAINKLHTSCTLEHKENCAASIMVGYMLVCPDLSYIPLSYMFKINNT